MILIENGNGRDHLGDIGIDGRLVLPLKWSFERYNAVMWTRFNWLSIEFSDEYHN